MSKLELGTRMATNTLNKVIAEGFVADKLKKQDKELFENDWYSKDETKCTKCKGSGFNSEIPEDPFCMACEGTGNHYVLYYGVKNKQTFSYTVEYGIDLLKEYCKTMREAVADQIAAGKLSELSMIKPFELPKTLEMNLMAEGIDVEDMKHSGRIRELATLVRARYPDFMTVPLTWTKF